MTYRSPAIAQWVSLVSFSAVKTQDEGRGTFLSEFPSGPGVFIHVGRVLCGYCVAEVDRSTWPWNRKITFVVVAVAAPLPRAALSLFPSFLWRSRDYLEISRISSLSPSLVPSSVAPPCVCPLRPVGAAYGARSLRE